MDAISYQLGGKRDAIGKAMDKQGLSGPIVRFLDDRLELLIYSKQYDKVLTVGVSFASLPDGRLTVHLDDVHVGRLKVPQWVVSSELSTMQASLAGDTRETASPAGVGMVSSKDMARLLRTFFAAIDGQPIQPELKWRLTHKKVKIASVDLYGPRPGPDGKPAESGGEMILHIVPVGTPASAAASQPPEDPDIIPLPH